MRSKVVYLLTLGKLSPDQKTQSKSRFPAKHVFIRQIKSISDLNRMKTEKSPSSLIFNDEFGC